MRWKQASTAGFEPARAKPNRFQVCLLNHSDISTISVAGTWALILEKSKSSTRLTFGIWLIRGQRGSIFSILLSSVSIFGKQKLQVGTTTTVYNLLLVWIWLNKVLGIISMQIHTLQAKKRRGEGSHRCTTCARVHTQNNTWKNLVDHSAWHTWTWLTDQAWVLQSHNGRKPVNLMFLITDHQHNFCTNSLQ